MCYLKNDNPLRKNTIKRAIFQRLGAKTNRRLTTDDMCGVLGELMSPCFMVSRFATSSFHMSGLGLKTN